MGLWQVKIMIGWAFCGSYCTVDKAIAELDLIKRRDNKEILPIFSDNFQKTDTRFGKATEKIEEIERICERKGVCTIVGAEPLGPKVPLEALIIAPCTGNTLAKLASGISDTPVTMAAKAHLRSARPLIIALSTNDALSANLGNLATMLSRKNVYIVPLGQDDAKAKPNSLSCDFSKIGETLKNALEGKQIQPLLV